MSAARRSAVVKIVALCLLASPTAALGQQKAPAQAPGESRTSYRSNRALTNVIIYGSIGAIVGALSTLRKRNGADSVSRDDEAKSH